MSNIARDSAQRLFAKFGFVTWNDPLVGEVRGKRCESTHPDFPVLQCMFKAIHPPTLQHRHTNEDGVTVEWRDPT